MSGKWGTLLLALALCTGFARTAESPIEQAHPGSAFGQHRWPVSSAGAAGWRNASLLTVVIPCAGMGTRLGLPYPKEMLVVGANTALIDLSLRQLAPHAATIRSVVIVIEPSKHELVGYLEKWRDVLPLHFAFFNTRYYEWAGSVLSAEALFGESNLVLLPDSLVQPAPGLPLVPTMLEFLSRYGLVFGYVPEERYERLRALGALAVTAQGAVEEFCDKPSSRLEKYNGFWGIFGFRRDAAPSVLRTMMASIAKETVRVADFQTAVGAFPLQGYQVCSSLAMFSAWAPFSSSMCTRKVSLLRVELAHTLL